MRVTSIASKFFINTVFLLVLGNLIMLDSVNAQITAPKFGKGINIMAGDSSFTMKVGFRFQTLFNNTWNLGEDKLSNLEDYESGIMIRRSRLKFDGWAFTPKLKYKAELSLSNRDNGGGNSDEFSNAANIILDAFVEWNFYGGLSLWAGQGKMPGNRERLISSGNLQFVDRSRLNSRFTTDRDVGVMLKHKAEFGEKFILKSTLALVSGEGKNITSGNIGGAAYTAKVEAFPFGAFKGAYVGSDIGREETPKLAIAVAYDTNKEAGRTRGQKGSFIEVDALDINAKDLNTFFADLMFKQKGTSVMIEYVTRTTDDDDPHIYAIDGDILTSYYTGSAINVSAGQMLGKNNELAVRWTRVEPDVASDEDQFTLGFSKYFVGHKLKVQSDLTYRALDTSEDDLFYRIQMDLHF